MTEDVSVLRTRSFWRSTIERAIKTFAQSLLATIGISALTPADIDWLQTAEIGGVAALLSVLTSLASANIGDHTGPSLADEELVAVDNPAPPSQTAP